MGFATMLPVKIEEVVREIVNGKCQSPNLQIPNKVQNFQIFLKI